MIEISQRLPLILRIVRIQRLITISVILCVGTVIIARIAVLIEGRFAEVTGCFCLCILIFEAEDDILVLKALCIPEDIVDNGKLIIVIGLPVISRLIRSVEQVIVERVPDIVVHGQALDRSGRTTAGIAGGDISVVGTAFVDHQLTGISAVGIIGVFDVRINRDSAAPVLLNLIGKVIGIKTNKF